MARLEGLDVLDGSPPCSTFSIAGLRDRAWGRKKRFREGQAEQTLDMLFFDFIALAAAVRPKVVVAENVKGMLGGRARDYVKAVVSALGHAGYDVQVALLDAADHGVPQRRERVFFVARRKDLGWNPLRWPERQGRVAAGDACEGVGDGKDVPRLKPGTVMGRAWDACPPGMSLSKGSGGICRFNTPSKLSPFRPSPTVTASQQLFHWDEPRLLSAMEATRLSGFPDDYDYMPGRQRPDVKATYVCGMSVPPPLMRAVASEIRGQWFGA
jgi:DNA (cytosine-5)-methyltransferase 1